MTDSREVATKRWQSGHGDDAIHVNEYDVQVVKAWLRGFLAHQPPHRNDIDKGIEGFLMAALGDDGNSLATAIAAGRRLMREAGEDPLQLVPQSRRQRRGWEPNSQKGCGAIDRAIEELRAEVQRAASQHREYASAHEGYAVLLEEVDELKEHVWARAGARNKRAMRVEVIQVAAVAIRFAATLCDKEAASCPGE